MKIQILHPSNFTITLPTAVVLVLVLLMFRSFPVSSTDSSSSASIFLTKSNYDSETFNKTVFIKWAAPWCSHSQELVPVWDLLVSAIIESNDDDVDDDDEKGGELLIAEVDCSKESEWCIEMGYLAYPTLTYGDSSMGGIFLQQYTSLKKSYDDLLTFAKEKLVHKSFCTPGNIAACADEKRDRIRQYSDRTIHDLELLIEKEESLIDEARRKVGKRNKGLQLEYDQISKRYESETAILKRQLKLYKKLLDQALTKVQR